MNLFRPSLESRLRNAVLIPSGVAVVLTIIASQVLSWLDYKDTIERSKADLSSKAELVARRISAEFLIGPRGAPRAVAQGLKNDLNLESVTLDTSAPCAFVGSATTCAKLEGNRLRVAAMVKESPGRPVVVLTSVVPTFRGLSPLRSQFWLSLPFLALIGFATYLQQRQLRKYFLRPINSIIAKTDSGADIPKHWPREFVQLHSELDDAFQKREQAIIGQIASGIIHDLKTLLQPISGATQLASESPNPGEQSKSIEMLLRACQRNIPKIHRILEAVLDGNREIRLQRRRDNLSATLHSAARNASEAVENAADVQVDLSGVSHEIEIDHDSNQLERALTNLIKNGIEAASLSRSEKRVRVTLVQEESGKVRIGVEDSGRGLSLPLDQLLASRRSSKFRGTGLGLLVSRKIVEAHRGTLSAGPSEALPGAKFQIELGGTPS